jgi:phosphoribosyl 1,2-cyclic phosphate phosphodiesterase
VKLIVLGCGTSSGVPRIGNDWGACDPAEPRNRRTRASILVESDTTTILVDTGPICASSCWRQASGRSTR